MTYGTVMHGMTYGISTTRYGTTCHLTVAFDESELSISLDQQIPRGGKRPCERITNYLKLPRLRSLHYGTL